MKKIGKLLIIASLSLGSMGAMANDASIEKTPVTSTLQKLEQFMRPENTYLASLGQTNVEPRLLLGIFVEVIELLREQKKIHGLLEYQLDETKKTNALLERLLSP